MKRYLLITLFLLTALVLSLGVCTAIGESTEHEGPHNLVTIVERSCFTKGLEECTICGKQFDKEAFGYHIGATKIRYENEVASTCTSAGHRDVVTYCDHCKGVISRTTETLGLAEHTWPVDWTVVRQATCTEAGLRVKDCTVCGTRLATEEIPATGHAWGSWITVSPTCTTPGYQTRTCGNDPSHTERQAETPALGHDWGEYVLTTAPTCTAPGIETSTCRRCGTPRTRSIPATGHRWDAGEVTTSPTCTTPGVRFFTCLNDPSHTKTESIPKLGHTWTKWDIDPKPTCTEKGRRRHVCTVCGRDYTETMQPLGHDWGPWTVVREATPQKPGLEQRTCLRCGQTEEREIPFGTNGSQATMCVFGPRLKDVGNYLSPTSSAWYMFTPFDASVEGRQTYELVVDDAYLVGIATITVENGTVSLTYNLNSDSVRVDLEFFTFLPDMHILTMYEPEDLKPICGMQPGVPYSIAERFGGDTNLVLYFCSRVTYAYDAGSMGPLNYLSTYHQALLNNMFRILDK